MRKTFEDKEHHCIEIKGEFHDEAQDSYISLYLATQRGNALENVERDKSLLGGDLTPHLQ